MNIDRLRDLAARAGEERTVVVLMPLDPIPGEYYTVRSVEPEGTDLAVLTLDGVLPEAPNEAEGTEGSKG